MLEAYQKVAHFLQLIGMLVYSLPQTGAIFDRFGGINGSTYLVGGFGMTALNT
jgi:hypothetical protein